MEVKISAVNFTVAERLEAFVNKKAERLSRFAGTDAEAHVTLKLVKPESAKNKEASIRLVGGVGELYAQKTADTFEEAFDEALDAVKRQIEKKRD